jgi:hypothetical protein
VQVVVTDGGTVKVIGEINADSATGVLGRATGGGATHGVRGEATNGYGLSTPDDAAIEGLIDTLETDFVVNAGTTSTTDAQNVVLGHTSNEVRDDAVGATIGGGGRDDETATDPNVVTDNYGTVGGGQNNVSGSDDDDGSATATHATVGGGDGNTASGSGATVGGGVDNTASVFYATVGGGFGNTASGIDATVGGGASNTASGSGATVGGGFGNTASGKQSFAAGSLAKTETSGGTTHNGAFVWGDSSTTAVRSSGDDETVFQAGGGVTMYSSSDKMTGAELVAGSGTWSSLSTHTVKTNVEPITPSDVLAKVEKMNVSRWEYNSEEDAKHMGPMAEEFYEAFGLGPDDQHITGIDADGVAFAAIQGLADRLEEKDGQIAELKTEMKAKADRIKQLETTVEHKNDQTEDQQARIEALEEHLDLVDASGRTPADD